MTTTRPEGRLVAVPTTEPIGIHEFGLHRHLLVSERLRVRRRQLGLTQKEVVARLRRLGVDTTNKSLSSLEHGAGLDVCKLPELARALDCTLTYLVGLSADPVAWQPDEGAWPVLERTPNRSIPHPNTRRGLRRPNGRKARGSWDPCRSSVDARTDARSHLDLHAAHLQVTLEVGAGTRLRSPPRPRQPTAPRACSSLPPPRPVSVAASVAAVGHHDETERARRVTSNASAGSASGRAASLARVPRRGPRRPPGSRSTTLNHLLGRSTAEPPTPAAVRARARRRRAPSPRRAPPRRRPRTRDRSRPPASQACSPPRRCGRHARRGPGPGPSRRRDRSWASITTSGTAPVRSRGGRSGSIT